MSMIVSPRQPRAVVFSLAFSLFAASSAAAQHHGHHPEPARSDSVKKSTRKPSTAKPSVAKPAPSKPAPAKIDTVKIDTVKIDTVKTVKIDTVKIDAVKVETVRVDSAKVDSVVPHHHAHTMAAAWTPLGIPWARHGSGTGWIPDASPMYGCMTMTDNWMFMLHGMAFLQYVSQGGARGDEQFGSVNWAMGMAQRVVGGGRLTLRGMVSVDAATVGGQGYPLLLQSGESYRGNPLHDRQHPHDLLMEVAAHYERPLNDKVGISLYVAPVGEPATGPVAFMHRPSSLNDPFAPIGHHWQDATHITFGVVTAGIFTKTFQLEGSVFNGREPDEDRYDFDFRRLDSYAGRLTINLNSHWSFAGSFAYLKSPEGLEPEVSKHRATASALYGRATGAEVQGLRTGMFSAAVGYGGNRHSGAGRFAHTGFAEANWTVDMRNSVFGRAELAQKDAHELVLPEPHAAHPYNVAAVSLGYIRELVVGRAGTFGLGVRGTVNTVPSDLEPVYGTRTPLGGAVFLRVRPNIMRMMQ